ncbi:hypothetical protein DIPPA_24449 [Diplonema papillatum]|nr:hypothetical protein DIPPA_24449 [Diplonema papillatum]|eukprot:gene18773-28986_t
MLAPGWCGRWVSRDGLDVTANVHNQLSRYVRERKGRRGPSTLYLIRAHAKKLRGYEVAGGAGAPVPQAVHAEAAFGEPPVLLDAAAGGEWRELLGFAGCGVVVLCAQSASTNPYTARIAWPLADAGGPAWTDADCAAAAFDPSFSDFTHVPAKSWALAKTGWDAAGWARIRGCLTPRQTPCGRRPCPDAHLYAHRVQHTHDGLKNDPAICRAGFVCPRMKDPAHLETHAHSGEIDALRVHDYRDRLLVAVACHTAALTGAAQPDPRRHHQHQQPAAGGGKEGRSRPGTADGPAPEKFLPTARAKADAAAHLRAEARRFKGRPSLFKTLFSSPAQPPPPPQADGTPFGCDTSPQPAAAGWAHVVSVEHESCVGAASRIAAEMRSAGRGGAVVAAAFAHGAEVRDAYFRGKPSADADILRRTNLIAAIDRWDATATRGGCVIDDDEVLVCEGVQVVRRGESEGYAVVTEESHRPTLSVALGCQLKDRAGFEPGSAGGERRLTNAGFEQLFVKVSSVLAAARGKAARVVVLDPTGCASPPPPAAELAEIVTHAVSHASSHPGTLDRLVLTLPPGEVSPGYFASFLASLPLCSRAPAARPSSAFDDLQLYVLPRGVHRAVVGNARKKRAVARVSSSGGSFSTPLLPATTAELVDAGEVVAADAGLLEAAPEADEVRAVVFEDDDAEEAVRHLATPPPPTRFPTLAHFIPAPPPGLPQVAVPRKSGAK